MFQNLLKLLVPLSKYNILKIKVIFWYFKRKYVNCLAYYDCNVFTFDIIYGFAKFKNMRKNRNCIAINKIMKISFISTFREEYRLSENVIFIYLNVQ